MVIIYIRRIGESRKAVKAPYVHMVNVKKKIDK